MKNNSYPPSLYSPPTKEEMKRLYETGMFNSIEWHEKRITEINNKIKDLEKKLNNKIWMCTN